MDENPNIQESYFLEMHTVYSKFYAVCIPMSE